MHAVLHAVELPQMKPPAQATGVAAAHPPEPSHVPCGVNVEPVQLATPQLPVDG